MQACKTHYFIDHSEHVNYREQAYRVDFKKDAAGRGVPDQYEISICLPDPDQFLDSEKTFNDNIKVICAGGAKRGKTFDKANSDFHNAYSAGMRNLHDDIGTGNIAYIALSTKINLAKTHLPLYSFVDDLAVSGNCTISPVNLTYETFSCTKPFCCTTADDDYRKTAFVLAQDVKENKNFFRLITPRNDRTQNNETGKVITRTIGYAAKCSAGKWGLYQPAPMISYIYDETMTYNGQYVSLQEAIAHKDKQSCPRLTDPYSDPAALFNLYQIKRSQQGKTPRGVKEAQRAIEFLNEQEAIFRLSSQVQAQPAKIYHFYDNRSNYRAQQYRY